MTLLGFHLYTLMEIRIRLFTLRFPAFYFDADSVFHLDADPNPVPQKIDADPNPVPQMMRINANLDPQHCQGVHSTGVLRWLFCWAHSASTRDFCLAIAALVGPHWLLFLKNQTSSFKNADFTAITGTPCVLSYKKKIISRFVPMAQQADRPSCCVTCLFISVSGPDTQDPQ